jgi:hypothetical protein
VNGKFTLFLNKLFLPGVSLNPLRAAGVSPEPLRAVNLH